MGLGLNPSPKVDQTVDDFERSKITGALSVFHSNHSEFSKPPTKGVPLRKKE